EAQHRRATAAAHDDSMKILFLHGWQSVPGGVKPTFLAQHGHEVINPKLPDEDFEEAVRIAQAEYDRHRPAALLLPPGEKEEWRLPLPLALLPWGSCRGCKGTETASLADAPG